MFERRQTLLRLSGNNSSNACCEHVIAGGKEPARKTLVTSKITVHCGGLEFLNPALKGGIQARSIVRRFRWSYALKDEIKGTEFGRAELSFYTKSRVILRIVPSKPSGSANSVHGRFPEFELNSISFGR